MSGGSFDYLYAKTAGQLFDGGSETDEQLESMANALDSIDATRAAADLRSMLGDIRSTRLRVDSRMAELEGVMHAVEWWHSCDWSEAQAREETERYDATRGRK